VALNISPHRKKRKIQVNHNKAFTYSKREDVEGDEMETDEEVLKTMQFNVVSEL